LVLSETLCCRKVAENEKELKKGFAFCSMMEIISHKDLNHIEEKNLKKFHHYFAL